MKKLLLPLVFLFPLLGLSEAARAEEPPGAKVSASFGKGLSFESEDGTYSMNMRVRVQPRLVLGFEEGSETAVDALIRRARLQFRGHFFSKDFEYSVQLGFSNLDQESDLRVPLRDAYFTWKATRDLNLRFGQMKVPFARQRRTSSSALQFVDRSLATGELSLDRDVGVTIFSGDLGGFGRKIGYDLGIFGGDGRNRNFTEPGVLLVARLVFQPLGGFADSAEASLVRESSPKLALGLGAALNTSTARHRSTFGSTFSEARFAYRHAQADLLFKWGGFSLLGELLYRKADSEEQTHLLPEGEPLVERSRSGWGWYAQAGQMLSERVELVARVGEVRPLPGFQTTLVQEREVGAGLNWYLSGQDFKLQGDLFHLEEEGKGSWQFRIQTQIWL